MEEYHSGAAPGGALFFISKNKIAIRLIDFDQC